MHLKSQPEWVEKYIPETNKSHVLKKKQKTKQQEQK